MGGKWDEGRGNRPLSLSPTRPTSGYAPPRDRHGDTSGGLSVGFFEKVGRRTEEIKQRMTDAAAEGAMFECANCGAELFTEPEACPECGSEAIVERVEESGGASETGEPRESGDAADESREAAEGGDQEAAEQGDEQRDKQGDEPDGATDSTDASED